MSDLVAQSLADHFTRAWDMMLQATASFPEGQWRQASDDRLQPARIVYHILMGMDRYTWLQPADDYLAKRQFNLDWMKTPAEQFPNQTESLQLLEDAKAKTLAWIEHFGAGGLATEKPLWPWTGSSALAQGMYHLRHLQHHLAELTLELHRRNLPAVEWK